VNTASEHSQQRNQGGMKNVELERHTAKTRCTGGAALPYRLE
jgi:hypothetical protein